MSEHQFLESGPRPDAQRNRLRLSSRPNHRPSIVGERYICAFRGRRDDYQVPLALAEANMLERLATDIYWQDGTSDHRLWMPSSLNSALTRRYKEGLPSGLVRSSILEAALERALGILPVPRIYILDIFDRLLSRQVARMAASRKSNLFVYSPHADFAFRRRYKHPIRKVLFQFHPHWRTESRLLEDDQELSRAHGINFGNRIEDLSIVRRGMRARTDDAWRRADLVVCASSFTRKTLLSEGASPKKVIVVPYGTETVDGDARGPDSHVNRRSPPCRALFVGTGVQRKGLHHLLLAWQRADVPTDATLTIVSRTIDPGLRDLVARTKQTVARSGVSAEELDAIYRSSSFFCMPSLVEGFGQVFLEALSRGLPILGTPNTCIPDLGGEQDGVFCCPAGDIHQLVQHIERLTRFAPGNEPLRRAARDCAARFTWPAFRKKIVLELDAISAHSTEHASTDIA